LGVRKAAHLRTVREVLRDGRFAGNPRLRALLVEVEVALGQVERAAGVLPAGDDDALTLRARALVASMHNQPPRDYLPALAKADDTEVHVFFDDIRLLLDESEEVEWAALPAAERAAWIRRKWEWRAMMAGIDVEQRIGEHHRRMKTALETYPRRGFRGSPPMNSMWLERPGITKQPLDDRGLIYLRHGAPEKEVALLNTRPRWVRRQLEPIPAPVLAWRYGGTLADGGVFEFAKIDDRSDWFLIEPTPACPDAHVLTGGMASGYTTPGDHRVWSDRLRDLDPARAMYYDRCAMGSAFAAAHFLTERSESREQAATAMSTETAVPRFGRPLAGAVNLYGFRSSRGGELVAYFGIPGDSLTSRRVATGEEYALRVRIAGGDPSTQQVVQRDTVIRFVQPAALPPGAVASTSLSLPLPAGSNSRVVLNVVNGNDTTQGQVMSGMRTIPAASGMVMSDIVVALDRDGSLQRAGHALAPALGHVVAAGQNVRVYYELYGVAANAPLQVDIEISPGQERSLIGMLQELIARKSAVAVQFREAAEPDASGMQPTLRTIGLDVEPGRYELSVKVTNLETGVAVGGTTGIIVLEGVRR
ncbi:MAG TPA: hypothetical protein VK928_05075, partial [Longimicrobiales bacterium]|nr:hypothetical protein [Longimicrobiales bacterium]